MAYTTKNKMMYASNKNTQGVGYGYGGFRDSVDMGWVWTLKFNPHGRAMDATNAIAIR